MRYKYEHECDHSTRFISYPEVGEAFCALCEIDRLLSGIRETIAAFHDERARAFSDTWWLRDGCTVYDHLCLLLPDYEPEESEGAG